MQQLLDRLAHWLNAVLPDAVRLPSLTFELQHAVYWLGLAVFPLIAMYLVRQAERRGPPRDGRERIRAGIAWVLWAGGGFVGLHRFYLRAPALGFVYIGLFLLTLYASNHAYDSRNAISEAASKTEIAKFDSEHYARQVERGTEGAVERLAKARAGLKEAELLYSVASGTYGAWRTLAGATALVILVLLLVDAARMRTLIRRCRDIEEKLPPPGEPLVIERGASVPPRRRVQTPFTRAIGAVNGLVGTFIAYWSVLAVAAYYFEVIARYVFNSPTNWVHESMFLMFGMQYLLAGGFALREDAHVRVDVLYEYLSERGQAITDLITSIFFFIFTVALLVSGYIFASDAIRVWEVSFTEWAIQYWPVKCTIFLGALLITLQGLTNVIQDIVFLARGRA